MRLKQAPPPPKRLSARAAEEWRLLAPKCVALGTLTDVDDRALELLCETLATEAAARKIIAKHGVTVSTAAGGHKPHAAIRIMETARTQATKLLEAFGLTPKSRDSLKGIDYEWRRGNDED